MSTSSTNTKVTLPVRLDQSVKGNQFFESLREITISHSEIFSYYVTNIDIPPKRIGENEFEYRQSRVPDFQRIYEEWIEFDPPRILSWASNTETAPDASEIIGVAVSIKYFVNIVGLQLHQVSKILIENAAKKRMDFKAVKNGRMFFLESRGTTHKKKVNEKIREIKEKKQDTEYDGPCVKIGVVVKANYADDMEPSYLTVADSFDSTKSALQRTFGDYLDHYRFLLSVLLDNPMYNKMIRLVQKNSLRPTVKLFQKTNDMRVYEYKNTRYIGYFFDRRLIVSLINETYTAVKNVGLNEFFSAHTKNFGQHKVFLGIDEMVFESLANRDMPTLEKYLQDSFAEFKYESTEIVFGGDGVIAVISKDRRDDLTEKLFPENEVKKRLKYMLDYLYGRKPHKCGASCRSRDKFGKACEILTFREHCHFHR